MQVVSKAMCNGVLALHLLSASVLAIPSGRMARQPAIPDTSSGSAFSLGSAEQYVIGFSRYPGYEGTLDVSGTLKIVGTGLLGTATQTLSWDLQGVDPDCKDPPTDVTNSCGVHIHESLSCAWAGGHYWDSYLVTEDPWSVIRYTARRWFRKSPYFAHARGVVVNTGLTNYDVLGHTMVVHDATGARVACGLIASKELSVNAFTPYVGYTGSLSVSGQIGVFGQEVDDAAAQHLSWSLMGIDPACSQAPPTDVANACGIHVHEGESCYVPAGGHYWNATDYPEDPWKPVIYTSWNFPWGSSAYERSEAVITGLANSAVDGRAMIVHDVSGARVACGILAPQKEIVNAFVPYFSYTGPLVWVEGSVFVEGRGVLAEASQELHWILYGVDPDCASGPGDAGNSCGVHIHAGMHCTANAGGHYWNSTAISEDPWATISYTTKHLLGTYYAFDYNVQVVTGLTNFDTLGHTLIVHDYTGARIACGILNIAA